MKQPESGRCSGRFYRTLLGLGVGTLLLAACGQKGPLYLPDQPPPHSKPFSDCDAPNAPCRQPGAGAANSTPNTNSSTNSTTNTTPSAPAATTPAPVSSTATPESTSP